MCGGIAGVVVLILATALLVWVSEKNGNSAQKIGKFFAWVAIVAALAMMIGQFMMCKNGKCMGMMGKHHMMMMDNDMSPPPMPPEPTK